MGSPLVSIGLPFHNAVGTLPDAIRSVFAQTYTNWELILVADGSTDGSDRIAAQIDDARVRTIVGTERRFLAHRLNQIAHEATGQFLARMDADDLSHPARLEQQVRFLLDHREVDGCGTGVYMLNAKDALVGVQRPSALQHEEICATPLRGVPIAHATFVARTEWFRRHPYDERLRRAQDWGLWLSSLATSRFANVPDLLYLYRSVGTLPLLRYWATIGALMTAIWRYGRVPCGVLSAARALFRLLARSSSYTMVAPLGLAPRLSGRSGSTPTPEERVRFSQALRRIQGTELPLQVPKDSGTS